MRKRIAVVLAALGAIVPAGWIKASEGLIPSQRTVLNMNFVDLVYEYRFIDHVLVGDKLVPAESNGDFTTPGYYFTTGNPTWSTDPAGAHLDTKGYPQNIAVADKHTFGNHILV